MAFIAMVCSVLWLVAAPAVVSAQAAEEPSAPAVSPTAWQYGGFVDVGYLRDFNEPSNHLFRSRGTAFHVNEWDLNMAGAYVKRKTSEHSRWGAELLVQGGKDLKVTTVFRGPQSATVSFSAAQALPLLQQAIAEKPDGIIIWDDYVWEMGRLPAEQRPKDAVDLFLGLHADQLAVLERGYQVVAQRTPKRQDQPGFTEGFTFARTSRNLLRFLAGRPLERPHHGR